MIPAIIFRPESVVDIQTAYDWYETARAGLGREFQQCLDDAVESIIDSPNQYPKIYKDIRRKLLKRFPYGVHYVFNEQAQTVVVLAVFHFHRDPEIWKTRD